MTDPLIPSPVLSGSPLAKWVQHHDNCRRLNCVHCHGREECMQCPCTCGLADALRLPAVSPQITEWHSTNIFCDACDTVQPCQRDPLADGACDLVCGICHRILATLHQPDAVVAVSHEKPAVPPLEALVEQKRGLVDGVLYCYGGCGTPYVDFPIDVILPTALWNRIAVGAPFDETHNGADLHRIEGRGGVLCPTCIAARLSQLPDCTGVFLDLIQNRPDPPRCQFCGESMGRNRNYEWYCFDATCEGAPRAQEQK